MSLKKAIEIAYEKGYRVTNEGKLIGLKGNELKVSITGKQKYPTFSVNVGSLTKSGVYGIPVHRFAGFCFYGNSIYESECIRHLNGNVLDYSKDNLTLGTHSENELDKRKEDRVRIAKIARASQGKEAHNRKFTEQQVKEIKDSDLSNAELGRLYNVTRQCIHQIRKGRGYN